MLVQMFGKNQSALSVTAGAESAPFAGEGDQLRVFAVLAVCSRTAVGEDAAVEVGVKGGKHCAAKRSKAGLKLVFPEVFQRLAVMVDDPIEYSLFRDTSGVAEVLGAGLLPRGIADRGLHRGVFGRKLSAFRGRVGGN